MTRKKPPLPKAGDTSAIAVGQRLRFGRAAYPLTLAAAAAKIDADPNDLKKWEAGHVAIPKRHLFLFAWRIWGPLEWLQTGKATERDIPATLPKLGDDLSAFAARVRQARERMGFLVKDAYDYNHGRFFPADWQRWENGEDEPGYEAAVEMLKWLQVRAEWLYTPDTEPPAAKRGKPKRLGKFAPNTFTGERSKGLEDRLKQAREAAGLG